MPFDCTYYETLDEYNQNTSSPMLQGYTRDAVVLIGTSQDGKKGVAPEKEDEEGCRAYSKKAYKFSGNVVIPARVKNGIWYDVVAIGAGVFFEQANLRTVTFEASNEVYRLAKICSFAFNGSGLTSIKMPESLNQIKNNAFSNCTSLTSIEFNKSLDMISTNSFNGCTGLKSVVLPPALTRAGGGTFSSCSNLTWLALGGNKDFKVSTWAFDKCDKLQNLLLIGGEPKNIETVGNGNFTNATLYVPNTTQANYDIYTQKGFHNVVPIVDPTSIRTGAYGSNPTATLNLTKWDGTKVDIAKIYYTNAPNGCLPAGNYKQEPITIILTGGLLEGVVIEIRADFVIDPLPLDAQPFNKKDKEAFTYGNPVDFNAYGWGINFSKPEQFYPGEGWWVIDHNYIDLALYKDGQKVALNSDNFYDAGTYEVKGSDQKHTSGVYKDLSKCNSSYAINWTGPGTVVINKASQELSSINGDWDLQGDLTLEVGETKPFQPATAKTKVTYTIVDAAVAEVVAGKTEVKGLAEGKTRLKAQAEETNNYLPSAPKYINVTVVKKESDLDWPATDVTITTGGDDNCTDIAAATGTKVTYTVEGETSRTDPDANGSYTITTDYLTILVDAEGNMHVCGITPGTVNITACTTETAERKASCQEITVNVVDGELEGLPKGYITWGTEAIHGVVGKPAKYDAPKVDETKKPVHLGEDWSSYIELSITLSPADKADVKEDWRTAKEGTLDCKHATNGTPAILTLTAHDAHTVTVNGETRDQPAFRDAYWHRQVIIDKKGSGIDWPALLRELGYDEDGIHAFVEEVKPLPEPDVDRDVHYTCPDDAVTCTQGPDPTVVSDEDGKFVVRITVDGDDDTEADEITLPLTVTKRDYVVAWDNAPISTSVGETFNVPTANITDIDGTESKVTAEHYQLPGNSVNLAHYNDGEAPVVANATFEMTADAPGQAIVNVSLPETNVYNPYSKDLTVTIDKKTITVTFEGDEWYRGEVGDKLLLPAAVATDNQPVVYEMANGFEDYVKFVYLPDGTVEAELLKVSADAQGRIHTVETQVAKASEDIIVHFEIKKRSNDLDWPVADHYMGYVEQTLDLPLASTKYGDPATIVYEATSVDGKGRVPYTQDADGLHLHLDHADQVKLTATLPQGDRNEQVVRTTIIDIKAGPGDLIWPVNAEYNTFVGDHFELPAPHSTYVDDENIDIYIPELADDQWSIEDGKLKFTPEVGGDVHVYVNVPSTDDRTGVSGKTVVHVSKKTPVVTWEVLDWPQDKLTWKDNVAVDIPEAKSDNYDGPFVYETSEPDIATFERTAEGQLQLVTHGKQGVFEVYVYTEATEEYEDFESDHADARVEGHAAIGTIAAAATEQTGVTYDLQGRRVAGNPAPGLYVRDGKLIRVK